MKKIDFFDLIITPTKYKVQIIIINVIVVLLAAIVVILSRLLPSEISYMPNVYTAEAKIFLPSQEKKNNSSTIEEISESMELTVQSGVQGNRLIISILNTNYVIDGLIDSYLSLIDEKTKNKLASINKKKLRSYILSKSNFIDDTETGFITITFTDTNPETAKKIVDSYLNMLSKATYNFAFTQTSLKKKFIEERIKDIEDKLDQAKKNYINFQQEYGIISPEREAEQITTTIAQLRTELMQKEAELAKYNRIHNLNEFEKSELEIEIFNLKKKIINLTKGTDEDVTNKNIVISKSRISQLSLEFAKLKRNVDNLEYLHMSLLNELEIAQIQEKSEGPIIQVIESPEIPFEKSGPKRSILFLIIVAVFFGLSISVPIISEFIKKYIWADPDIRQKIEILLSNLSFKKNI